MVNRDGHVDVLRNQGIQQILGAIELVSFLDTDRKRAQIIQLFNSQPTHPLHLLRLETPKRQNSYTSNNGFAKWSYYRRHAVVE